MRQLRRTSETLYARIVISMHMHSLGKPFNMQFARNGMLFARRENRDCERGKEIGRRERARASAPDCRRYGR